MVCLWHRLGTKKGMKTKRTASFISPRFRGAPDGAGESPPMPFEGACKLHATHSSKEFAKWKTTGQYRAMQHAQFLKTY